MRLSVYFAVLISGVLSFTAATAQSPVSRRPDLPDLNLPDRKSQGQRAIDLLGNRLPEIAAHYRKSAEEFRTLLLNDRRMKLDRKGRVFFEDEIETPLPIDPPDAGTSQTLNGTLAPLDQTFKLHSKPGSKRTIYLDFDGATLTGTSWNSTTGLATINARPFDLDGVPYSFSTAELQRIQYIWQRVAEDYAAFDVNVTTEQPSADKLTRSGSGDDVYGTTVLVTYNDFYNCSCGGVAYLGVFDATSDTSKPALVFYNALGSGNEKYVAEAISHEAGHNMGLGHDGTASTGYYQGHGSGATGWAPIMGVGYYQSLVQWSKGEYAGANNVQDDYSVMAGNGLLARPDDHGNSVGTATPLNASTANGLTTVSGHGVIERPTDVDVFSFAASAGAISISASPAARSANLDLLIELRNSAGVLLASANPTDALNATLTYTAPSAATYYVFVRGTGKGDPLNGGYTNYGSLGLYQLSGTASATTGQPPVASFLASTTAGTAPLSVNFNGSSSYDPDGSITGYQWNFGDGSPSVNGGATASHVYNTPGTYNAALTVTDNAGLSATNSVTITVNPQVVVTSMSVADIAMSVAVNKGRNASATARVTIRDASGNPVSGATVSGQWSGLVSGNGSAVTDGSGVATMQSANTKNSGTFVFTVTGVTLSGYSYNPNGNAETTDSIQR